MNADEKHSAELRKQQAATNEGLSAANVRLIRVINDSKVLGLDRALKFQNALLTQFNRRTFGYVAALEAIADTFEEMLKDARKSAGLPGASDTQPDIADHLKSEREG